MSFLTRVLHPHSLQGKFLAITIPLVLVATLTLFGLFEFRTHRIALQNLRHDLDQLLSTQSAALANPLWNVDDVQITLTLAAIRSNRDVLGVELFGDDGRLFDAAGSMKPESGNAIVAEREIVFQDGDAQHPIGRLRVAVTDTWVREATRNRLLLAGGIGFLVVISVVLSAVIGNRRTTGVPLERLLASIRLAQQGNVRKRVDWESEDEIGAVVSAFNDMQAMQEAYEADLRSARDMLEHRVEERTAELATARDQAQMAQTQLTEALQSIEQGFALYDPEDRLVLWNQRYEEYLYPEAEPDLQVGLSFKEILQNAIKQGLIPDAETQPDEWLRERFERHRNPGGAHQQQRSGDRWIQVSERRIEDGGTVAIYTEITELKRREQELADLVKKVGKARDEAQGANEAKSAFLAMMSHEVRTPMNAIIGMTSLLLNTKLTPEQQDFTETVRHSGESLLTIINEILDFSKIDAGRMDIEAQPFDLHECLENSLDLLAGKASEKGLELAYLVDEQTPAGIKGDVTRLRQILVNLLSNAIKFTEHGEVVLSVSCRHITEPERGDGPANELQFAVSDTGIGIPADRMDRLFRSFSQVDASTTRRYGGTGLGLAISKRLSELMGGTMWVESTPGEGTTFHFTVRAEAAPAPSRDYLNQVRPELAGKRVLVVDDNATNRLIVSRQTASWGMHPIEAASAGDALALLQRGELLDIGILDMQMPDMDGAALAAAIRQQRNQDELPLVMLSSFGADIGAAGESLFAVSLIKPIKSSQLYNALVGIFASGPLPVARKKRSTDKGLDPGMAARLPLRILLTEDDLTNQKLALRLLEQLGYRADVAANGLEALEALERQSYDVVLMDMQMPEMDGLEATRRIRGKWSTEHGPRIVALTANAMQGDREVCLAAGMDDYVSKPIRVKELVGALNRAGPHAGRPATEGEADALEHVGESPADAGAVSQHALEELRDLLGGQEYLLEIVVAFLDDAPKLLAELRKGYQRGDAAILWRIAHTLKSRSADFGASAFSDLCRELESMARTDTVAGVAPLVEEVEAEYMRVKAALDEAIRG